MSAVVCGKRSLFEDLSTSPPVSKRTRCNSSSPVRFSPPRSASGANPFSSSSLSFSSHFIEHLQGIFPDMDKQLLERALEECGDDLNLAIKSLNDLRIGSVQRNLAAAAADHTDVAPNMDAQPQPQDTVTANGNTPFSEDLSAPKNSPIDGAGWVELFVGEMTSAFNIDDARARASRALEVLEKSICARAGAEAAQSYHQENMMLKEQMEALIQENSILKRAVSIQHERQKEYENRNQELQQLKQLVSQYQEQLRNLEVNNYALTMHLKQAQQSSSLPGRFHPDVF